MTLVKVKSHSHRDDLYGDEIVASQDEIEESDKVMVNSVLLIEVALNA